VEIIDENFVIKNVWITVNGILVAGQSATRDLSLPADGLNVTGKDKQMIFTSPLDVEDGPNTVTVFAHNGLGEGRAAVSFTADINQSPPNLWLLAIGVNNYTSPRITNLSYAVNDAQVLAEVFRGQQGKNYGRVNTLIITDNEARKPTAAVIRENFGWFRQAATRDLCMLFIAGHAVNSGGNYYFLPADTAFDGSGSLNTATAISHTEINAVLNMPGRKLFILDTCHSAGVSERTGVADTETFLRGTMKYYPVIFSSSRGDQLSQEGREFGGGHGLFTYGIVQGMGGRAISAFSGNITMMSLNDFVSQFVKQFSGGRQTPITNTPEGYENFILAIP
jgi:uncharacterized caspase-like protein